MRKALLLLVVLLILAAIGLFLPSILGGGGITNFTGG